MQHIISSLLWPHHLPASTPNYAFPPVSFTNLLLLLLLLLLLHLLHFTMIPRALHSLSNWLPTTSNFRCFCVSLFYSPLTPLEATYIHPARQISSIAKPWRVPHHSTPPPKHFQCCFRFCSHSPSLPPISSSFSPTALSPLMCPSLL